MRLSLLSLIVACVVGLFHRSATADGAAAVHWRLVGNDIPAPGLCSAQLTLEEPGFEGPRHDEAFLYFNRGRLPAGEAISSGTAVEHVNGDLFRLPIEGSRTRWTLVSQGAIRNVTDAPSGFYIVTRGPSGTDTAKPARATIDMAVLDETARCDHPSMVAVLLDAQERTSLPVVPHPAQHERRTGAVSLSGLPIVGEEAHSAATRWLSDAIASAGSPKPQLHAELDAAVPAIRLSVGNVLVDGVARGRGDEAYALELRPDAGVSVVGSDAAGLFYGVQTLVALIENEAASSGSTDPLKLAAMMISDAPHFHYRGLLLDVARNFHDLATVRRLIDMMATYKLNRFHFHLTDDEGWRVEIEGLPELTEIGSRRGHSSGFAQTLPPSFGSGPDSSRLPGSGYYSREDFIELLRYARDRYIEVIPEIDLPGHSRAAIQAMRVRHDRLLLQGSRQAAEEFLLRRPDDAAAYQSVQMWNDNVIDVRLPSSRAFVRHVVREVAAMYEEAGLSLNTIHFGGDEVPTGCWGEDAAAEKLFKDFMKSCADVAADCNARAGGWEEVFLHEESDTHDNTTSDNLARGVAYVWNNIWGWGQEDAAYRLANDGTDVILCNATHLYFDLAQSDSPTEPGYYWAGTTDTEEAFGFHPYDYLGGLCHDRLGSPISEASKRTKARLTTSGRRHVVGIQGHLWGENLNSASRLDYMAFPRVLALAERAWCGPADTPESRTWQEFSQHLGKRELPRLDRAFGGVGYRVPTVRLAVEDSKLLAASALAGMTVRYTTDGTMPDASSDRYEDPLQAEGEYRFRVFDTRGRGGPVTRWQFSRFADSPN